jgi:RHS repeat-associated protein
MAGYSTGSDNLLTSDGTFNYQHDADGNTTVRTRISNAYATDYRTTYSWDYRNRLTDVDYYDNNPGAPGLTKHVHFIYDVFDNLIGEQDNNTGNGSYDHQEFYVVGAFPESPVAGQPPAEAVQPLLEFAGGGALAERFLVAPNPTGHYAVLAQGAVSSPAQADVVTWMADDDQGTPRDEVDNSGMLANHSVFSAFGEDVYDSNPSVAHWNSFAGGHQSAATGFENEDERWLDLPDGDWFSQDPSGLAGGDSNLTRYVNNSPANATDLTGLWAQYQITSIVTAGSYYTTTGGMGHFWNIERSDGTNTSGSDYTPGAKYGPVGLVTSATPYTYVAVNPAPSKPAAAPPTSVYSLMLEVDPTLAAKIHVAQGQIQKLAYTNVAVYAAVPMVPLFPGMPSIELANGMISAMEQTLARLEAMIAEAQAAGDTAAVARLSKTIHIYDQYIANLREWVSMLTP